MGERKIMKKDYLKAILFIAIAYGFPWACSILAGKGMYAPMFMNFMSTIPAFAVGVVELAVERKKCTCFHICYILAAAGMLVCALAPRVGISNSILENIGSWYIIALSGCLLVYCGMYGEEKLSVTRNGKMSIKLILLALIICTVTLVTMRGNFELEYYAGILTFPISIGMTGIAALGEEYAWRGTVQPLFQEKFGKRWGILATCVVWELWHTSLYINAFRFDMFGSKMMEAIALRVMLVFSIGILIGWAYMKTGNIWMCAAIHCIYNLSQQNDKAYLVLNPGWITFFVICFALLFTKEFRKNADECSKTMEK